MGRKRWEKHASFTRENCFRNLITLLMIKELYNYKTAIPLNLVVCELVADSALRVLLAVSLRIARLTYGSTAFEAAAMFSQRFSPFS